MKPNETGMRSFEFRAILVDGRARGAAEMAGRAALRRGFETKVAPIAYHSACGFCILVTGGLLATIGLSV